MIKCKFASIISAILYFPIQLLRIILPWYQQIMYFLFAVVFPAGLGVFILRIISSLGEYNLSNELIYFVSYTLSAILASNHRFGDLIIKITLSKKIFKERAKVSAEYDVKAIRYLIYRYILSSCLLDILGVFIITLILFLKRFQLRSSSISLLTD